MHLLLLVTNIIRVYKEANAIKRRKRYARPLVDLHMKIYRYGGMEPWSPKKRTISGKLESFYAIINNSCQSYDISYSYAHDSYHTPSCITFYGYQ